MSRRYLYKLKEDFSFKSEIVSKQLEKDLEFPPGCHKTRLEIKKDGKIIVKKDYAWDGCSPKFNILDLFWVGTPDGAIDEEKPATYYASLVHDALGQFCHKNDYPFDRNQRDRIFKEMLDNRNFKLSWIYYQAVRIFGRLCSIWT